ncbi:zinc-ribbon domain-containing protein [Streptomyces sp. NRRL S-31]|uniref:zinc-ribbon domain-containing protein n=1 Tax=Streptomyces sp. NRRL S-31 TaxID=1463898 RepID=UPI0004C8B0A9|nr:zinc-ribbon domain-containing protein [Streptomyces sp. NRRL S-31]
MRRRTVTAGNLDEILQVTTPAPATEQQVAAPPVATPPPPREDNGLRTEFEFELPRGYVDEAGTVHRQGTMRLATARDELRPQIDLRVKENPAYLSVVLLSQVITRLGNITDVHAGVVERMYATDVAFLQDFYRRVNSEGHTRAAVTCPHCEGGFEVDLSGGRLGES